MAAALPALRAMRIGGPARRLSGPAFRMSRAAYAERQRASLDPGRREAFWLQKAIEELDWFERPTTAVDLENPTGRWFPDGVSNLCHNALDRHVAAGLGAKTAISYVSAVGGASRDLTYAELLDDVARFAGGLAALGVEPGDRVLLYMPMIPEAAVAMLACARLGAVHSVVFGGFAARELAARVDAARPKVVVAATCGLEGAKGALPYMPAVDEALDMAAHDVPHVVVAARPETTARYELKPGRNVDFRAFVAGSAPAPCARLASGDPLYTIYTSGTTGEPKGILRDNSHPLMLKWSMEHYYGTSPDETFFAASDIGWVVGHSYIVYGPLLHGATSIMFEGKPVGTPDAVRAGVRGRARRRRRARALRQLRAAARARPPSAGDLLAHRRGAQGREHVHGADGAAGDPQVRPRRRAAGGLRRFVAPRALRRGRARGPGHGGALREPVGDPGRRPLVADGERVPDVRRPVRRRRHGARLLRAAVARLRPAGPGRGRRGGGPGRHGQHRDQVPAAAGFHDDALRGRRALPRGVPRRVPGLLQRRRRGLPRRARLLPHSYSHGRHHQRRGPPPVDGRARGGDPGAPARRRVRLRGRRGRAQGPNPARARRDDRRRVRGRRGRGRPARPGTRRRRRRAARLHARRRAAEDAVGEDPPQGDPRDRRRRRHVHLPGTIEDATVVDDHIIPALSSLGYPRTS